MDLSSILYLTGATGYFSSRAFLPAFFTAVFLKYGVDTALLSNLGLFNDFGQTPVWFTSDAVILGLGILALLEATADKIPEARQALNESGHYLKAAIAFLMSAGVLGSNDIQFIEETLSRASTVDLLPSFLTAAAVFQVSRMRGQIFAFIHEADEDDDLGFRGILSWLDDLWASFGFLLFFLVPLVMVVFVGLFLGAFALIAWFVRKQEQKARIPCPSCGESIFPMAMQCPACRHEITGQVDLGYFGQPTPKPARPRDQHLQRLREKKRCPSCAERLGRKSPAQQCSSCKTPLFSDTAEKVAYSAAIQTNLPKTLLISGLLGLIPVAGLIAALLYYRGTLITPYNIYIPSGRGLLTRWGLRLLFFVLIGFQIIPFAGAGIVVVMAFISHSVYKNQFDKLALA